MYSSCCKIENSVKKTSLIFLCKTVSENWKKICLCPAPISALYSSPMSSKLHPAPALIMPRGYELVRRKKVKWFSRSRIFDLPLHLLRPDQGVQLALLEHSSTPSSKLLSTQNLSYHGSVSLSPGPMIFWKNPARKLIKKTNIENLYFSPSYAHTKFHMSVLTSQHTATCSQYTHDTVMMPAGPGCKK